MLVVAALGGNALLRRGEPADAEIQRQNVKVAAGALAEVAERHDLVVTHGNGPQVGLLALQNELVGPAFALDILDAETEGMIGYLIEQALENELPGRSVATLLTQVVVDADDPAFGAPTKPIGPMYTEEEARRLAGERGWTIARDGDGFRRVVASPAPLRIVELAAIRLLSKAGVIVVCAGGGGVPVVVDHPPGLRGVAAVVDKDRTAALVARDLDADALLLLTDVPGVYFDWNTPKARLVRGATPAVLRERHFAEGSMAPKIDAACWFVEETGGIAGIGALGDAVRVLDGDAGTLVRAGSP